MTNEPSPRLPTRTPIGAGSPGAVLDRDGWRCRRCRRVGRMEVDHVVPLDRGGDPANPMPRVPYREDGGGEPSPPTPANAAWRALVSDML